MKISEDAVFVDGKPIGMYDLYATDQLASHLTSDELTQKILLTGSQTILEVLHNAVDQRVIADFQIVHRP